MAAPSATSAASGRPCAAAGLVAKRSAAAWLSASTFERASTTRTAVARRSRMAAESGAPLAAASGATVDVARAGSGQPPEGLGVGLGGVGRGGAVGLCGEFTEGWRTWNVVCWLVITGWPALSMMLARRKYEPRASPE